ncbi:MAG: protein translocase subunit SecF [Microgenomates group bacterium]|jgi:preprotein translocase subunit SecF|nr:protein translocase subunit SecF [Microgenomates group bacterium]
MVNFLKYRWLYFLISAIVIASGFFSMLKWGFHYSIDFVGGTNIEYQTNKKISAGQLKPILTKEKIAIIDLQIKDKFIFLRTSPLEEKKELSLRQAIEKNLKIKLNLIRLETVGPTLGKETMTKTFIAGFLGILGILIYMSFAFKGFNYALSAVLAMIHDFFVVLGSYSLLSHFLGAQLDTLFVTAVLTTMSFSVHDTIVIFDKVREYFETEGKKDIEYFANKALTETMVRSINNSMTIVFMLLALLLVGGTTIRFFIAALLIGTITGTYSSPFVATPILVWLEKRKKND